MSTRWTKGFVIAAVAMLVCTAAWLAGGRWALIRYPDDLDVTLEYAGTVTQHLDQTGAPLATPLTAPLTIKRTITTSDTSFGEAVVTEAITNTIGPRTTEDRHSYVLDRRSMELKAGERSWAYSEQNRVDRSDTYRINLPMGIEDESTAKIWNNETGQVYSLDGKGVSYEAGGLDLLRFSGHLDPTPLSQAFQDHLQLPATTTLQALAPQLKAAGIDLAQVQAGLARILSPQELAAVGKATAAPIPLRYTFTFNGTIGVEPDTGAIVELSGVKENIAVKPDLSGLSALTPLLVAHAGDPVVQQLSQVLQGFGAAPATPVLDIAYSQTPASVQVAADEASSMRDQMRLVNTTVPAALAVTALVCFGIAAALWVRRRQGSASTGSGQSTKGTTSDVIDLRHEEPRPQPVRHG